MKPSLEKLDIHLLSDREDCFDEECDHVKNVVGAALIIINNAKDREVPMFFGHDCTDHGHVKKHRRVFNPVVTNSSGQAAVCLEAGTYTIRISGVGIQSAEFSFNTHKV